MIKPPPSLRQASISLLLKKGKDTLSCSSYRPINLLNVGVKILAKVLALCLEYILPTIISSDQTGFIKNRHVRRVFHILYTLPLSQRPEVLLYTSDIEGIFTANQEHKFSLYADDNLLYVSDPLSSIPHIINTLKEFGRFSGYKLNLDKSELLPITTATSQIPFHSLPFKLTNYKLSYLGISVTKSHSQIAKG